MDIFNLILNHLSDFYNNLQVLNVAVNKAKEGIIFAVADETENMDLVKRFNLQDSGEEINVGCVGKGIFNKQCFKMDIFPFRVYCN